MRRNRLPFARAHAVNAATKPRILDLCTTHANAKLESGLCRESLQ